MTLSFAARYKEAINKYVYNGRFRIFMLGWVQKPFRKFYHPEVFAFVTVISLKGIMGKEERKPTCPQRGSAMFFAM